MNMVIWWHPRYWYLFVCTTLLHVVHRFLIMPWIGLAFCCTCAVLPHENLLLSLKRLHNNHYSHFVRQWINWSNGGSNHTISTSTPALSTIRRGSIKGILIHLLLQLAFLQRFCSSILATPWKMLWIWFGISKSKDFIRTVFQDLCSVSSPWNMAEWVLGSLPLMQHLAFCGGVYMFVPFRSAFRRPAHP